MLLLSCRAPQLRRETACPKSVQKTIPACCSRPCWAHLRSGVCDDKVASEDRLACDDVSCGRDVWGPRPMATLPDCRSTQAAQRTAGSQRARAEDGRRETGPDRDLGEPWLA